MDWSPLTGLTTEANALFAEEWSLLDWLLRNWNTAAPEEVADVLELLVRNGERIDRLGDRKFA